MPLRATFATDLAERPNWAISEIPAADFAGNAEAPQNPYLSTDEIGQLSAALYALPNRRAADAVRLILLTGARRGEVLSARWDQFDLDAAVRIKPIAATKQRCLNRTPISASAAALLQTIRFRVPNAVLASLALVTASLAIESAVPPAGLVTSPVNSMPPPTVSFAGEPDAAVSRPSKRSLAEFWILPKVTDCASMVHNVPDPETVISPLSRR